MRKSPIHECIYSFTFLIHKIASRVYFVLDPLLCAENRNGKKNSSEFSVFPFLESSGRVKPGCAYSELNAEDKTLSVILLCEDSSHSSFKVSTMPGTAVTPWYILTHLVHTTTL